MNKPKIRYIGDHEPRVRTYTVTAFYDRKSKYGMQGTFTVDAVSEAHARSLLRQAAEAPFQVVTS